MKKTMMYLPEELHAFLAEEAQRRGSSMAEIAREAIAEYRAHAEAPVANNYLAIVGVIEDDGPETDLCMRVDEVLAEYFKPGGEWEQEHGLVDSD